ncbi:MAG: MMPL family transporter [Solirubrobacterales bacterium]
MTGRLYSLAGLCVKHRRVVVGLWIVLAIAITVFSSSLGKQFADNLSLPGKDSQQATDLVDAKFPSQANGSNPVLFKAKQGKITDSSNQKAVEDAISKLSKDPEVTSINNPFSKGAPGQVSKGGEIAYASMLINDGPGSLSDETAQDLVDKAHSAGGSGLDVAVGGYLGQQISKPSTESSEVVGLVVAMIVLALTFGTVVAMGLPILSALFGLLVSLGLITILSNVATVSTVAPTLSTMIGLGVGIDYALFVVTRHRQAMHQGHEPPEAAARAAATAGGAVVFAGSTVVVALLSLGLAGIPLVWTLGYTAAIAVVVAMFASITFLPALLAMVGHKIEHLKIPLPHNTAADHEAHGWRRWAEWVARHPIPAVIFSVVLLLVIALPVRNLHLGQEDDHALPKSTETRQAYDLTTQGFGVGQNGPLLIAMDVDKQADVQTLSEAIVKAKGIASVTPPALDKSGDAVIFNAVPTTSPSSTATEETVSRLRDTTIPDALKGTKSAAHVGGQTAGYVDLAEEISDKLPQVILLVVALSFLVLMLAFRSVVVPLQAAAMNLLSIGAAYGLVTFVFQEGHGASLIGLEGAVPVVSFLPLVMFAILFGLSMDYEVFLLTQIKEAWHRTSDSDSAVIAGVTSSGRVITSAALIMVAVFFSFVLSGDPVVKQFGVGLAFAVAIDATIVRCLLVPAVMILMKRSNWWFPGWLDRIVPRIDIEGNEYFDMSETEAQLRNR